MILVFWDGWREKRRGRVHGNCQHAVSRKVGIILFADDFVFLFLFIPFIQASVGQAE